MSFPSWLQSDLVAAARQLHTEPRFVNHYGRGVHKPSVLRRAASTGFISANSPSLPTIALLRAVARLSVMITESVRSPEPLPPRTQWDKDPSRMATAGKIACNHRNNDLRE